MAAYVVIGRCNATGFQFCPREFDRACEAAAWINAVIDGSVTFTLWDWRRGVVISESAQTVKLKDGQYELASDSDVVSAAGGAAGSSADSAAAVPTGDR